MPELTHFPFYGGGQAIRLLLHKAGVKYKDVPIDFDSYETLTDAQIERPDLLPIYTHKEVTI